VTDTGDGMAQRTADALTSGLPGYTDKQRAQISYLIHLAMQSGREEGHQAGYTAGYEDGFTAGFLTLDLPEGTYEHRIVQRETVREALWPTAPDLKTAITAHNRELDRKARRDEARNTTSTARRAA